MENIICNEKFEIFYNENISEKLSNDILKELEQKRKELLEMLQIKKCRKVKIFLFDRETEFRKYIKDNYNVEVPIYCRGTIQKRKYNLFSR